MSTAASVPRANEFRKLSVGLRFYLLFVLFTLLIFPLHESAHYLTYRLLGVHLHMTLNTASPQDQSQRKPIAELAGPLLNLVIASGAAVVYHNSRGRMQWASALALAAALMRLVIYILVVVAAIATRSGLSLGNDEPIAAHFWGLPSLTFVAILTVPFALIVWSIVQRFQGAGAGEHFTCLDLR